MGNNTLSLSVSPLKLSFPDPTTTFPSQKLQCVVIVDHTLYMSMIVSNMMMLIITHSRFSNRNDIKQKRFRKLTNSGDSVPLIPDSCDSVPFDTRVPKSCYQSRALASGMLVEVTSVTEFCRGSV